ncbi:sensor histidine kinase [Williamsia sterculiae]|uniref:histidine kinase n=1 Tax=Williamsia sterculiae TaxID=1344003 RepID=A0A1N7H902_9NOCA|nr:histidine kinase [Williamsia sterculiae]SIS21263.1 Signal transduction histidine kinase [Williamsia sterculiae]
MSRTSTSRHGLGDVRIMDGVITAAFLAVGIVLILADVDRLDEIGLWQPTIGVRASGVVLLVVACGFQLVRRAHPAVALVGVLIVLGVDFSIGPSIPVWLVYSDVVYAAVTYGSTRVVRATYGQAILLTIALPTAAGIAAPQWRTVFLTALWMLAVAGSPIAYAQAVREHRKAAQSERERTVTILELAESERTQAVVEERQRLARELHDVVAGQLSAIAMRSAAALRTPGASSATESALAAIRVESLEALTQMRAMIDLLAPEETRKSASLRRLDHLITGARSAGTPVTTHIALDSDSTALPAVVDIAAYRILAESITNATRHAAGSPITVSVNTDAGWLELAVSNPSPESIPRVSGHGLHNMRTRAESVGGDLVVGRDGAHWRVHARLPLGDATDSRPEVAS